jgi:hypothetical protein
MGSSPIRPTNEYAELESRSVASRSKNAPREECARPPRAAHIWLSTAGLHGQVSRGRVGTARCVRGWGTAVGRSSVIAHRFSHIDGSSDRIDAASKPQARSPQAPNPRSLEPGAGSPQAWSWRDSLDRAKMSTVLLATVIPPGDEGRLWEVVADLDAYNSSSALPMEVMSSSWL